MTARKQINFRVDEEILLAVERIRRRSSPIPSMSEVIRQAVLEKDRALAQGRRASAGKRGPRQRGRIAQQG